MADTCELPTRAVDVCVIGGGISGMATAYFLNSIGHTVGLLEKSSRLGGVIETEIMDGFILENGPQTCLLEPEILMLARELSLEQEILYTAPKITARYIGNPQGLQSLNPLPQGPLSLLSSPLFSTKDLLLLAKEFLITHEKKENKSYTLQEIFEARFGKRVTDQVISAAFLGLWATPLNKLGAQEVLPHLLDAFIAGDSFLKTSLRRIKSQSKLRGRHQIVSFKDGLSSLVNAIRSYLPEDSVLLSTEINSMLRSGERWTLELTTKPDCKDTQELKPKSYLKLSAKALVIATPASAVDTILQIAGISPLIPGMSPGTLPYAPLGIMHITIPQASSAHREGFGVLIPPGKSDCLLGSIFTSSIFPDKVRDKSNRLYTLFVGGAVYPEKADVHNQKNRDSAVREAAKLFGSCKLPDVICSKYWPQAIPQYGPNYFEDFKRGFSKLKKEENIYLCSNIEGGTSIPARIKDSLKKAAEISLKLSSESSDRGFGNER